MSDIPAVDEPYPGLRSFRRDETHIFFGRETIINEMVDRLAARHFLAVTGTSGSGKSSLVRTGLLDALDRGLMAAAGADWRVADFRPGRAPLAALVASLIATVGDTATDNENLRIEAILARGPLGLVEWLNGADLSPRANLLLLVDQFEEIFRFRHGAVGDDIDAFVALLLASAKQRQRMIYVVLTMRSDFLGECAQFSGLAEAINEGQFLTPRMTREQCRSAIEGPAAVFGGRVEPALVTRLLNDMGTSADQLPLVQHALMRLWHLAAARSNVKSHLLCLEDYEKLGGIGSVSTLERAAADGAGDTADGTRLNGALSAHADEILAELSGSQQRLASILFRALTESEGTGGRDVRHPVTLSEAAAIANVPPNELVPIVEAFRAPGCNLLVPASNVPLGPKTVIDITHESLIRQWTTLRNWVREEYRSADNYRIVETNAKLWKNGKAAVLNMPYLGIALAWREEQAPNAAWAARYGDAFDLAMDYLERSDQAEKTRVAREEAARRRSVIRTRAVAFVMTILALLAAGLAYEAERSARQAETNAAAAIAAKNEAETAKAAASEAQRLADEERDTVLKSQSRFLARESRSVADDGDFGTALQLALAALPKNLQRPDRPFVVDAAKALANAFSSLQERFDFRHDAGSAVLSVAFSPDGTHVLTSSSDHTARIWNVRDGTATVLRGHDDDVETAAYSPDGSRVVTSSWDKTARIWDAATGATLFVLRGHTDEVHSAVFSPDGSNVVTASYDKTARIWDAQTGAGLYVLGGHTDVIHSSAVFSPDGTKVLTASRDGMAKIWDAKSGKLLVTLKGHRGDVYWAAFSPDGARVVTASADSTARIWNARTGVVLYSLEGHEDGVNFATFSPDGLWIVTASDDGTARLWNADTGARIALLKRHDDAIKYADFSRDGKRIVTASYDDRAILWDGLNGQALARLVGHEDIVRRAIFSSDGKQIATASADGTARLWDVMPKAFIAEFDGHAGEVISATFSSDGMHVLTSSSDHTARIWNVRDGSSLPLRGHEDVVETAAYSPDGTKVVTASWDKTARIWDATTGATLIVLKGHTDQVHSAAYSPDGTLVVTASYDRTARIWNAQTGGELHVLEGHTDVVHSSAVFSLDGTKVLTAAADKTARIWDAGTGNLLLVLKGHRDDVVSAVFSPDGIHVLTASTDKTARVWDAETGAQQHVLSGHRAGLSNALYSPDGRHILTADGDTARIWDAATGTIEVVLNANVVSAAFSRDSKQVITGGSTSVRIWDAKTGAPFIVLVGAHSDNVNAVAFSPDGTQMVSASADKTTRLWRLPRCQALIDAAREAAPHELSSAQRAQYFLAEGTTAAPPTQTTPVVGSLAPAECE